ncbi:nuclear prelamin A recognition factor [Protopterus annectens]|uniref:nuclear prelamin A recognition factor n=1 Tax=Protopterus annectens TaxID=7888 RepID=UPI001CFA1AB8|nr:nuclear prelamin A recognition factor [Protopterus annectens]
MKCENCTKTECNKKQKTEGTLGPTTDVTSPSDDDEERSEFHKLASAKIFLSDCLACDKCLTSEESVRIFQQSQGALFKVLSLNKKCDISQHRMLAVSLCPQSLPYFAAKFNLTVTDAARKLCRFLKNLGAHYVFDMTIAGDFSILESQREFVQRYLKRNQDPQALPMFASACPGWIRYAEKVLGSVVTPHICTAKSPQKIMGSLVKDYFARQQKLSPDSIYHLIIAPCYDKKLEVVQQEFHNSLYSTREVDCVLTSGEILQIVEQKGVSLHELEPCPLDNVFGEHDYTDFVRHEGKGSDGFLEHIFKFAAKEVCDTDVQEITYKTLKNKDLQEVTLEKNGEIILQFASAYGFRNIQNMVQKLKKGKFSYHYVEILACPGGCLNGKGQTQTEEGKADKELLPRMEEVYTSLPIRLPEANVHVQKLYQDWLEGIGSQKAQERLHTGHDATVSSTSSFDFKW